MTEDFLQYLWRSKKIDIQNLKTVEGESVELLRFGMHNLDSGPDFSNALLRINHQLWAGNIEIHIKNSDWRKHKHQHDTAYKSVILHVVYEYDSEIEFFDDGQIIPCLELKGRIDESLYWKYENLLNSHGPIVCYPFSKNVDSYIKESMLHRLMVERFELKTKELSNILESRKGDWHSVFNEWLFRGFGLKVNSEPMRMLALQIPFQIILRHRNSLNDIEALLFGVAGLLKKGEDEYSHDLKRNFNHLKKKYDLTELDANIWKFSRMRPHSFPSLRIAQLAAFLHENGAMFNSLLEFKTPEELKNTFLVEVSKYWQVHFRFGKMAKKRSGQIGKGFQQTLILNVILPILFLYGKEKGKDQFQSRVFDLLEDMDFEKNHITQVYEDLNFPNESAFHSQSLLHLNQFYCKPKKCLNCKLGTHLITIPT